MFRPLKFIFLIILATSCGQAKYRIANPEEQGKQTSGGGEANTKTEPSVPSASPLPLRFVDNKLLIVDLKSGWWNFHEKYLEGLVAAIATDERPNFEVELHHLTAGEDLVSWVKVENKIITQKVLATSGNNLFGGNIFKYFRTKDLNQFSQIWIFSGSDFDLLDWPSQSNEFADFVNAVKSSNAALYLASGQRNFSHVNEILAMLGQSHHIKEKVGGDSQNGANHIQGGVTIASKVKVAPTNTHPLFKDVKELPDRIIPTTFGGTIGSDALQLSAGGKPLFYDDDSTLLIGEISGPRKIILDSNIVKSYLIYNKQNSDVMSYYRNLFNYLTPTAP